MRTHALRDNEIISQYKDCMGCDSEGRYHCLLIYDNEQGDGLLVESEGYNYARYAQYIPHAKLIYEDYCRMHQFNQSEDFEEIEDEEMDVRI